MKKIISLFLTLCITITMFSTFVIAVYAESGTCGDNLTWTLDDNGTLTISGTGNMYDYDSYTLPWQSLGVETVVIENGVTSISKYAFYQNSSLKTVIIGEDVIEIGKSAFNHCTNLQNLYWNAKKVNDFDLNFEIFEWAGNEENGIKVVFGDKVERIPAYTFFWTNLSDVVISDSIKEIGENSLGDSSTLINITVSEDNSYFSSDNYGVLYDKNKTKLILYPCSNTRTEYSIPNGVVEIGDSAFGEAKLTSLEIPDSVTTIGAWAFNCCEIKSLTIGENVNSIGESAFYNSRIENITISSNKTNLGKRAFGACYWLKQVTVGTDISLNAFYECRALEEAILLDGTENIGQKAFYSCSALESVEIPKSVTTIGASAFQYCENLTDVYYGGTEEDWRNINIGEYNESLTNATIHYNSSSNSENKTEQNIVVDEEYKKYYGDEPFTISVTPDATANLTTFTYESHNTNVAEIAEDGTITIKGAGEATITVKQAGNDEYAPFEKTVKVYVKTKQITITSIDIENKTAVLDGILSADTENVALDFDKINIELGDAIDETTSNVLLKNFVLKGDRAANYEIITESLASTMSNDNIVTVTATADNGTVSGTGSYLKGSSVTVTAEPNRGYRFTGWYIDEYLVSNEITYTFTAEDNTALAAKFTKIPVSGSGGSGGGGSSVSSCTVKFETNGGSKIADVKVTKNDTVSEPTAPTKEGFEFAGWYTDKTLKTKYDFSDKVTKSLTLYAAWTEKKSEMKDNTDEPAAADKESPFTDVKSGDWFYDSVKYVLENGLMNGVSDDEFAPNDNLTRAMLVTILYRAENEPTVNKSIPFADVNADSYYANAVIWAKQNGIVSGVTENEFTPDENITREQIATIIYRYAQYKGYDVSVGENTNILSYDDFDSISEYAIASMQYAVGSGLMKGKTDSTLNPKDNATRAEIATILQRFIESNK